MQHALGAIVLLNGASGTAEAANPQRVRWIETVALGFAILFVVYAAYAIWVEFDHPPGVDFVSFWAAAILAAQGDPALAYDVAAHRAVELTAGAVRGLLPFPYPPPFLLLIAPLALLPFAAAFAAWLAVTVALYARAAASQLPLRYAFAHPAAHVNALIGQAAFVFCAIFMFGTAQLRRRPLLGGAILGLMMLKPQLALLLPVALLAGREWRAIAGGVLSAAMLLLAALLALGSQTYAAFLSILPTYASFLEDGRIPWHELASVFALLRFLGLAQGPALAAQAIAGAVAIYMCWKAWAGRHAARIPVLAAATLLAPPYLFTYDSLLLIVPLAWLVRAGESSRAVVLIWLLCLIPVISLATSYPLPNTIPLAALACLWLLRPFGSLEARTAGAAPRQSAPERRPERASE